MQDFWAIRMAERRSSTFQVLRCQENRAYVIDLDEGLDLIVDGGAIKAHHKKLTELPTLYVSGDCGKHGPRPSANLDSSHKAGMSPLKAMRMTPQVYGS